VTPMPKIDNEDSDFILKIIGVIIGFFSLRWVVKVFAGKDGKIDVHELQKLTAYIVFVGAFIYILIKEGERPPNTEHIFSDVWLFFIISGLLTVLSLEKIFETLKSLIELAIKLRTKSIVEKDGQSGKPNSAPTIA
jgi:hypothetical protein